MKTLPRFKSSTGISYFTAGPERPVDPPLVFIHGVGLRAESWGPQIERFQSDHKIYVIDLPGHGDSDPLPGRSGINDYSDKIAQFITRISNEPFILIGHSLGALIASNIATDPNGICCGAAAISTIFQRTDEAYKAVKERAAYILANPDQDLAVGPVSRWFENRSPKNARLCIDMINSNSPSGYGAAYHAFANTRGVDPEKLAISIFPMLFLTGENDHNSTIDMSKSLSEIAPKGDYAVIKEARHMVQLSHSKEVNDVLASWFEKVQGQIKI